MSGIWTWFVRKWGNPWRLRQSRRTCVTQTRTRPREEKWHSPCFVHQITLVHVRGKTREDQRQSRWTHGTFPWKSSLWSMTESLVYLLNSQWEVLEAGALKVGQERAGGMYLHIRVNLQMKGECFPAHPRAVQGTAKRNTAVCFTSWTGQKGDLSLDPECFSFFVFLRWSSLAGPTWLCSATVDIAILKWNYVLSAERHAPPQGTSAGLPAQLVLPEHLL